MEPIKKNKQVSTFLVVYLIASVQIGIGILRFQPAIAKIAGYDAWISIILAGISVHIIIWMQYKLLDKSQSDFIDINKKTFGKWIGGFFSILVCLYFTFLVIVIIRSYIQILQSWVFPELETWAFTLAILPLVYYIISGGFRTVTGISFFGLIMPAYLVLPFLYPLEYSNLRSILPIFDHSIMDIILAAKEMTLSYLGFCTLMFFYPFITDAEKSQKWAHLGNAITTFVYVIIALISFVYYSPKQLQQTLWATLGLWKIVEMPFVERFEYIGISSWLIVILPNICIILWASTRGLKKLIRLKQKTLLIISLCFIFGVCILLKDRTLIDRITTIVANFGFYFIFVYIPFLFCVFTIKNRKRKSA